MGENSTSGDGGFQGGLPTYAKAAELLGTVRVVIMMSAVPVVGALLSIPVLGEVLTAGTAMGVAITFLGAFIGAMARPSKEEQA